MSLKEVICTSCQKTYLTYPSIADKLSNRPRWKFKCPSCGGSFANITCRVCSTQFLTYASNIRSGTHTVETCSKKCFGINRRGIRFSKRWLKNMSISHRGINRGAKHYRWKGGRSLNRSNLSKKSGQYTHIRYLVLCYVKKHGKVVRVYRKEHRVIMEKLLRRPLRKREVVHHINHNSLDNRPENLMLFKNNRDHLDWHLKLKHQLMSPLQ